MFTGGLKSLEFVENELALPLPTDESGRARQRALQRGRSSLVSWSSMLHCDDSHPMSRDGITALMWHLSSVHIAIRAKARRKRDPKSENSSTPCVGDRFDLFPISPKPAEMRSRLSRPASAHSLTIRGTVEAGVVAMTATSSFSGKLGKDLMSSLAIWDGCAEWVRAANPPSRKFLK